VTVAGITSVLTSVGTRPLWAAGVAVAIAVLGICVIVAAEANLWLPGRAAAQEEDRLRTLAENAQAGAETFSGIGLGRGLKHVADSLRTIADAATARASRFEESDGD
jgi:hypothetical protein